MIIKNINTDDDIMRFVENAEKYGHELDCVIVAYTQELNPRAAAAISKKARFYAIDIKNPEYCIEQFRSRGISADAKHTLLDCPVDTARGLVPYGFKRTAVTIEAILRGVDVLFFVDNDVYPSVLKKTPVGSVTEDVDFFGAHLDSIKAGALITTGEYSGYNILPPASFDGMDDLLHGVQKIEMLDYWQSSEAHRCLAVQPEKRVPTPCTKILGGNTAITLSAFSKLPPFFSSYYIVGDELYLNRGEDTVLGLSIAKNATQCIDIGLNPLHDTYKNFPAEPDLRNDLSAQDRFYYACTGWVGRNPFMNHVKGEDLKEVRSFQRERLIRGLDALSAYTSNPKFNSIIDNFDTSWDSLSRYVSEYENVLRAWEEFIERSELT
ncbi:MAG: hypothetical protein FWH33_07415 [Oscillospiraceae bacterium]|nr:hypothetical protein [Oscillospiraceae bacterium]